MSVGIALSWSGFRDQGGVFGAGIKGGRGGGGKVQKVKTVNVGKRGSIVISKELVENLGISGDEKFTLRKTKAGIALKRLAE